MPARISNCRTGFGVIRPQNWLSIDVLSISPPRDNREDEFGRITFIVDIYLFFVSPDRLSIVNICIVERSM